MVPQSMRSDVVDSWTINLSLGLLPVLSPVVAEKAPLLAMTPSLFSTACNINSSVESLNSFTLSAFFILIFTISNRGVKLYSLTYKSVKYLHYL